MPKHKLLELESDSKNTPTAFPGELHFISIPAVPSMIDGNMRGKIHDDKAWFINKGQGLFLLEPVMKGNDVPDYKGEIMLMLCNMSLS